MALALASEFIQDTRFAFLGDQFSPEEIQQHLDSTEASYFPPEAIQLWGVTAIEGVKLLTAHFLQEMLMGQMSIAAAAASIQAGQSVGFQGFSSPLMQSGGYDTTPFGRQYENLRKQVIPLTGFYF